MVTFAKSQVSAFIASALDYCVTVLLVEVLQTWYVVGNAIGTLTGGIVNFNLNRSFVFSDGVKSRRVQLARYFIVWTGYFILTSAGVFLLTHYSGLNYLISKTIVSLTLAVGYNYPLQKKFVFR